MIRNAIQRFMYGRYGNDQLNVGLMVLYLVLYLLYWLTGADLLYWVSMVVLFTALFRLLSRSHAKRRAENSKFLQAANRKTDRAVSASRESDPIVCGRMSRKCKRT